MNEIKVDLDRVASDIDRNLFGGSLAMGLDAKTSPDKYLYVPEATGGDKNQLRKDVLAILEKMNFPNIRFASGNFVSGYRWMDGIGPRDERPPRRNLAHLQGGIMSNRYATNEFIQFCRSMNIEPYLTVNCGDGDMREAADFVEYCNGTGDTALAKLRRKHGFATPHKVKYWGVGNEVDGQWQIGHKTPQEYARAFTEFSKVMKRVDPDIKLVASGVSLWEDSYQHPDEKSEWVERAQLILEQGGDRIDYMSFHRLVHVSQDDSFENYMAFVQNYNEHLSAYEGLIRAVTLERGIKHAIGITVDEWNFGRSVLRRSDSITVNIDEWGASHLPDDVIDEWRVMRHLESNGESLHDKTKRTITLEDALLTALHFNSFIRHARSVRMANSCLPMLGLGIDLAHPKQPLIPATIYYPIELYSRTCGQLALDIYWSGDTFSGTFGNRAYTGIRALDVVATLSTAQKQLVIYVVNQNKDEAMETTISLTSGEFVSNVNVSVINGPDIKSENTLEKPNQVGIRETIVKASGKFLTYTFEPHSVTALLCSVN